MAYQEGSGSAGYSAFPAGAFDKTGVAQNYLALPSAPLSAIAAGIPTYSSVSAPSDQTPALTGYAADRVHVFGGELYMPSLPAGAKGYPQTAVSSSGCWSVKTAQGANTFGIPLAISAPNVGGAFPASALTPVWPVTETFSANSVFPDSGAAPSGYVISVPAYTTTGAVTGPVINVTPLVAATNAGAGPSVGVGAPYALQNYGAKHAGRIFTVSHVATKYMPASKFYAAGQPAGFHPGYDTGLNGEPLYDARELNFSVYQYEIIPQ